MAAYHAFTRNVRTTGGRDHLYVHYFGAIVDDGGASVDVLWEQELVAHPKHARFRTIAR
jgi:hypothetical protein